MRFVWGHLHFRRLSEYTCCVKSLTFTCQKGLKHVLRLKLLRTFSRLVASSTWVLQAFNITLHRFLVFEIVFGDLDTLKLFRRHLWLNCHRSRFLGDDHLLSGRADNQHQKTLDLGGMLSKWEWQREGHQDLLHPGERSLKGENKDGRRAEGDGEAADEVVDNVQQGQLGVIGSTCEIRHEWSYSRHLDTWGRRRKTWVKFPYESDNSSRWVLRGGQRQTRRGNHWRDLHNPGTLVMNK